MKTRHFLMMFAAAAALVLASACSKETPFEPASILGTWDATRADVSMMGQKTSMDIREIKTMFKEETGADQVYLLDGTLVITETTINGYPYKLDGNRLVSFELFGKEFEDSGMEARFVNVTSTGFTLRYTINFADMLKATMDDDDEEFAQMLQMAPAMGNITEDVIYEKRQ